MDGATPKTKTVLVVDDHASVIMLVGMMLRRQGYQVVTLGIGEAANFNPPTDCMLSHDQLLSGNLPHALIERIRQSDAIVSDYQYSKGLTGIDFIEQVRNLPKCKRMPVIIHSSGPEELLADNAQMQRAEALGIAREHVLSKDKPAALAEHLKAVLTARAGQAI